MANLRSFWLWKWRIIENYDGDGFRMRVNCRPPVARTVDVRILGMDTPEIDSEIKWERELAIEARDYLRRKLRRAIWITVSVKSWCKWGGRVLAVVRINGKDIAQTMIAEGYAVPYAGGQRGPFKRSKMRKGEKVVSWQRFVVCVVIALSIVAGILIYGAFADGKIHYETMRQYSGARSSTS